MSIAALLSAALLSATPAAPTRPTASFRAEHVQLRAHLEHVRAWAGELPSLPAAEQPARARQIVAFFEEHIAAHAKMEEKSLYPLVDKLAGGGLNPFTATMRREHRVVERWIGELRQMAAAPRLDARAFARKTDNLLGLLDAHFESEEEVLLPVVDAKLTAAQFEKAMGAAGHEHP